VKNWDKIHHKFCQFAENETISRYFTLKWNVVSNFSFIMMSEYYFSQNFEFTSSLCCLATTIPQSVASVFDDMVCTCNHSALVKCILSQNGIVDVNFNWLANNVKQLKRIRPNKTTVAVYHFLSPLMNTVLKMSTVLSSITLMKDQHLQQLSHILVRCSCIIMPLCDSMHSTGAEVACTYHCPWKERPQTMELWKTVDGK